MGLIPFCAMEQLGFKTTSPDPYYYISEHLDICVLSELRSEDVKMVEKDKKYYVISGKDFTSNFVFEVNKIPQKQCGKPTPTYTTNYDSLYMARLSEGFDTDTRINPVREKNGATKVLQSLEFPEKNDDVGQSYKHKPLMEATQLQQRKNADG